MIVVPFPKCTAAVGPVPLLLAVVSVVLVAITLPGCATRTLMVGEWARPSDLGANTDSLTNVSVRVACLKEGREGAPPSKQDYRLCTFLENQFAAMGATIADDDAESDYVVQYIDSRQSESTLSVVSLVAASLTGWIVPSVSTSTVSAELRILDGRGYLVDRVPMQMTNVTAFGWLTIGGLFGESAKTQKTAISKTFYRFATNRLLSQVRLAKFAVDAESKR